MEAVCIGKPQTAIEIANKQQEADIAEYVEKYVNKGRTRQQYEECKALWPGAKTASDYKQMSLGDILADKLARKSALARLEAMGCIPRGSSEIKSQSSFVSCSTIGSFTNCSDGTSFNRIGNIITGSNGLNCSIFGSTMNCTKSK